jgi:NADH-quinone oxidoreductase subunit C
VRDQVLEAPEVEAPPAPPFDVSVLGDAVLAHEGDTVRVDRTAWKQVAELCRDRLHMDYFCFLSGIDWMPAPGLSGEKVFDPDAPTEGGEEPSEMETGVAGGDSRFQVFARLYSTRDHVGITLKADLDDADPAVESWTDVYRGADWHEREAWEMYGFRFDGHPSLRHIYLPGEFEGHPLRKDFPLLAREVKPWPGLVDVEPMPGEPEGEGEGEAEAGDGA